MIEIYAVVNLNQVPMTFSKLHPTKELAMDEAERLCKKEKAEFGILHLVGICKLAEPTKPIIWSLEGEK